MNKRQRKKRNKSLTTMSRQEERDSKANQKIADKAFGKVTREQWDKMLEWAKKRRAELRDLGLDIDD